MYNLSNIKYSIKIKSLRDLIYDRMIIFFNFIQTVVKLSKDLVSFRFLLTIKKSTCGLKLILLI